MASAFLALIGFRNVISLSCVCCILFLDNVFHNFKKKKDTFFICLGGEKEEGDDGQDLRRTESDSGLKKVFLFKIH